MPNPPLTQHALKGFRVKVWWDEEQKWFYGYVASWYRGTKYRVRYDDGDVVTEEFTTLVPADYFPPRMYSVLAHLHALSSSHTQA